MADMLPIVMSLAVCNNLFYSAWHPTEETMKRIAIYLRVSTTEQTVENQERELRAVADRAGWQITAVFTDAGISGAKGRDKRPGFDQLLKAATRREFDMVAAWSVDRLGRSLQDLVGFLAEIHGAGVDLYLHQQAIDTSTPAGKAMFQMMGVFAEFERAMIKDRVNSGIARAKAKGQRFGRPRVDLEVEARVRSLLAQGHGILKTAALAGVGSGTVQRIKAALA
jgi:DNA invertase Pin-like site-specific DNA recombinase